MTITRGGITYTTHYDALGHPIESGYGDGANYRALARLGYDDAGRNTWAASALGIVTTWRFDTEDQLLERSTLSNTIKRTQRYDYDQSGHLRAVTGAAGGTRRIGWNALGLPDALTDTLGRTMRFGYDAAGTITTVTDAVDAAPRFEVDGYGRPAAVVAPNGATTRYLRDDFGRIVATIGADSGKTIRRFDAADRLVACHAAAHGPESHRPRCRASVVRSAINKAPHPAPVTSHPLVAGSSPARPTRIRQSQRTRYDDRDAFFVFAAQITPSSHAVSRCHPDCFSACPPPP